MKRSAILLFLVILTLSVVPASAVTPAQMGLINLSGTATVVAAQLPNGTTRYTGTCLTRGENLLGENFSIILSFWWDSDGSRVTLVGDPPGITVATASYLDYSVEELSAQIRGSGAYAWAHSKTAVYLKGARWAWEKKVVTDAKVYPGGGVECTRYFG